MELKNSPIWKLNLCSQEDRISNLPKPILHRILCILELNEAIRTSILSKKWRYVWKTLPFLNFNGNLLSNNKHRDSKADDFDNIVMKTLILRERLSDLQGLRLDCSFLPKYDVINSITISHWIRYLVSRNIQQLYLSFSAVEELFWLPYSLFTSESLAMFEFKLASDAPFPFKLKLPESMSLPRLKSLLIHGVQIEGEINKIFSSCPVLESLTISHCEFIGRRNINITAPNLKHLVLENLCYRGVDDDDTKGGYNIKLNAPNLVSFRSEDFMSNDYSIENLSGLVKAEIVLKTEQHSYDNGVSGFDNEMRKTYGEQMMKFLRALHNVEDLTIFAEHRGNNVDLAIHAVGSPSQVC